MRFWAFLPVAALATLVALTAFVLIRGGSHETLTGGRVGRPAPAFALQRMSGAELATSAQFAGQPYVINVFASWCVPCRAEHSLLMQMKSRGARILGVAFKDRPEDTRAYLSQLGDPFDVVALDPDGRFALELGAAGVPETFVIGADGRVRAVFRGPLTPESVTGVIEPALGTP
ncbi:MAG TPA: DsbE family thiol:disulfide interchange protein [Caulobacterales bacterium]|nr:DsbE family thiol:disulfide interchange protein [Caulobacterales bacterium]